MSLETSKPVSLPASGRLLPRTSEKPISWIGYYELTKPRLSFLSVITALVGYFAALPARDVSLLACFVAGTALCAGAAAAFNQWMERREDSVMERTRDRPLPSGLVSPQGALLFGTALTVAGVALLWFGANPLAGTLGAATIFSYVAIYTPLKKLTRFSTEIGAIAGALPPLIGWAAATGTVSGLGWILFALLAIWQLPHFLAIAWIYRKDYAAAGFPMLSVIDRTGATVSFWALLHSVVLFAVSLWPLFAGHASWIYGTSAAVFGIWIVHRAWSFWRSGRRETAARKLFFNSIIYLPAVLFSLVIDRWILF